MGLVVAHDPPMNYASILGIDKQPKECTVEEVRAAYKSSALANHPDKGGDAEHFKMISEAYVKLMELKAKDAADGTQAKKKTIKRKREERTEERPMNAKGPMSAYILLGIERYLKTDDGRRDPLATLLRMESVRMKKSAKKPLLSFDTSYIDRIAHDHIEKIRKNFLDAKKDPKMFENTEWANRRSES